ncbi:hypothetical protein ACOMHN_002685 [Nucella lapillus]
MENTHQDGAKDLLQQFLQGADTAAEFLFLDCLFTEPAACKDKLKQHESKSDDIEGERGGADVKVCDIEITLNGAGVGDPKCTCGKEDLDTGRGSRNGAVLRDPSPEGRKSDSKLPHGSCSPPCEEQHCSAAEVNSDRKDTPLSDKQSVLTLAETLSQWQLNSSVDCVCEAALVEQCVQYVFERRFGPVDQHSGDNGGLHMHSDHQVVADLNRRLDAVIKRMMDLPVSAQLVWGHTTVLQRASGMPTMRKKLLEHVMLWQSRRRTSLDDRTFKHVKSRRRTSLDDRTFKHVKSRRRTSLDDRTFKHVKSRRRTSLDDRTFKHVKSCRVTSLDDRTFKHVKSRRRISLDDRTFKHVKALVRVGLSDVWSAVRKTCSAGVARLFRDWSPGQQEDLFTSFLEDCEELPGYLVECVLTVVFSLISHPQLSIRETVTRIMSSYMEHVNLQDMMDLMHQTLTLLTPPMAQTDMQESFHCVGAYAAEGLLNICTSIVKVLPMRKAVRVWLAHCKAFLPYLAHQASSVRQTTSTLVMHIATNRESSAVLVKLVMHHLTQDWTVGLQSLAHCHHFLVGKGLFLFSFFLTAGRGKKGCLWMYRLLGGERKDVCGCTDCWEGKEGCLMYRLLGGERRMMYRLLGGERRMMYRLLGGERRMMYRLLGGERRMMYRLLGGERRMMYRLLGGERRMMYRLLGGERRMMYRLLGVERRMSDVQTAGRGKKDDVQTAGRGKKDV